LLLLCYGREFLLVKSLVGTEVTEKEIRARIRLDFRGAGRTGRLIFGGKSTEKAAEEMREQQAAVFRNVPLPGVKIEDINMAQEVYAVFDEATGAEVAYAPLELTVVAEGIDDLIRLIFREEFRKIEVIEPESIVLGRYDLERLFFRMGEELRRYHQALERKYGG
jgi:aconitase B